MKSYIGDYLDLFVGKAKSTIDNATSGGIVSAALIYALDNKIIDGAILVGMDDKERWKPKVKLCKTKKQIIDCAGSKYSFIGLKKMLDIIPSKGKYAVVGLPCHLKAIRRLQKQGMYKNVVLLVGLFCGYNLPLEATEFILRKLKVMKEDVKVLKYRHGKYPGGFYVETKQGKKYSFPKHYYDFLNLMFLKDFCKACNDYTAEGSDISCGDAWGYDDQSVIIVRTKLGSKLINNKVIELKKIDWDEFKNMHWHNIKHKKIGDSFGLKIAHQILKRFGKVLPFRLLGLMTGLRRSIIKK